MKIIQAHSVTFLAYLQFCSTFNLVESAFFDTTDIINNTTTKRTELKQLNYQKSLLTYGLATHTKMNQFTRLLNSNSMNRRSVATYYTPSNDACTGKSSRPGQLIAAISTHLYGDSRRRSEYCGHCVRIYGPKGQVVAQIVDACPTCAPFSLDLSPAAFAKIGELQDGVIGIKWHWIMCSGDDDDNFEIDEFQDTNTTDNDPTESDDDDNDDRHTALSKAQLALSHYSNLKKLPQNIDQELVMDALHHFNPINDEYNSNDEEHLDDEEADDSASEV